jgi:long-chain acyl-CoA synthetase
MPQANNKSLVPFFERFAALGDEVAVRQRDGYRTKSWTYQEIAALASRFAGELESRGLKKGDAVLLWGKNSAQWIAAFWGCLIRGIVVVPLDQGSTADFAARVARETNAKLVVSGATQPSISGLAPLSFDSLDSIGDSNNSVDLMPVSLSAADTLEIIFTSGTTAEPRGVVISHGNILANVERLDIEIQKYRRYEKFFHPIRFLNLLPLSHVFGQMLGIFIPPLLGATVVFSESAKPGDIVDTIRRERVSVLVSVPRFIESLQRETEWQEEKAGRLEKFHGNFAASAKEHFLLRWWRFRKIRSRFGWKFWAFICGGAALPENTETFWNRLGYAVIQGYGMTETASLISLNHPFRTAQGSIGGVFPGTEVRVDENGEILVRGENVARAYLQGGASHSMTADDGWFRTGDMAERDADGKLYFKGRKKNVIVTPAGMNVYPEDLENALRGQAGVRDCVVFGLERDGNAEPFAALLMDSPQSDARAAVSLANESLAEFQRIRNWYVWPEPDFPRTPTQKPILPKIREAALASHLARGASAKASSSALADLVAQITQRPLAAAADDANLEVDLGLSSLDKVELMSALENRYQVDLSDAKFQDATTLDQIQNLVRQVPAASVEHVYPTWPQNWAVTAFRLAVYYLLAWPATYLMAAPRVRGREHLRGLNGPVLVIANHVTYLDVAWVLPALPARFRNRLATAMGGERLTGMRVPPRSLNPFLRFVRRLNYFLVTTLFNVFPLPQQSGFLKSFEFAGHLADRGWNVLVFPEGLTSETGAMIEFRSGIGLLAQHLEIPVVPMYLGGEIFRIKTERSRFNRPGAVTVAIGEPVRFSKAQSAQEIAAELERRVRALQAD